MDKKEELLKIGLRLRELRIKKGYTNYEHFAYDNKINRSQYGKYESGSLDIRWSTLARIIKKLDSTPKKFFSKGFD